MDASETSKMYISISDHVISKTRSDLVSNGKLKLSLLNEIHATWQRKMIQAGVISGMIETSGSTLQTQDPNPLPLYDIDAKELEMFIDAQFPSTELEMFIENGFYIPQQDGSGDADIKPNIYAPPPTTNEDDEELNENDDDAEDEGGIDHDNIPHLIICQFDNVKKKRKRKRKSDYWECKLKAGVMHINGKQIIFSEAKGDFHFY